MMESVNLPQDTEVRMLSVWANYIEAEYKRTKVMVEWHDDELLLTGISICAILIIIGALAVDVHQLRKVVYGNRT